MIPIQYLHDLAQAFMTVILLVPLVFVEFDLPMLVECQGDETVDGFRKMQDPWCVLLRHLEGELRVSVGNDFCGERL